MHWWQTPFSPPPSSSGSNSSADTFVNTNNDAPSPSSRARSFTYEALQRNRQLRSRKLRHFTDDDDVSQAQSTTLSTVTAQPLPLPDSAVQIKRDAVREASTHQTSKYILPLPEAPKKITELKITSHSNPGDSNGSRSIDSSNHMRDIKQTKNQLLRKSSQGKNSAGSLRNVHKQIDTVSGLKSPISRPTASPSTITIETPLDLMPDFVNPPQVLPERSYYFDCSLVHATSVKSPIKSNSPSHKNLSIENSVSRRGSNTQATVALVHPLPLPPAAVMPLPSPPPHSNCEHNSRPMISRQSQWKKGKLIGRGTFGSVYVGSNRKTGALCAMKEVELLPEDPKSAECIKQLEQEINVLSQLKHPNIVQYYGSEIVGDRFYIYLEYVHPGSINKYARDHCGGMTESIVRNFTRHIVSGLAYLHSTKTIHRDIKGANLLVDANGAVKLADFGMAKHLSAQASHLSLKGSPYWMAPELLQCGMQKDDSPDLALAIDIWSLGCTVIEMINGRPPWSEYEGPAAMFKVIKETPPIPETMSPEGKDFLRCCFIRNPAERPSASMLLQHRFLNSNQDEVENQTMHFVHSFDRSSTHMETPISKGNS